MPRRYQSDKIIGGQSPYEPHPGDSADNPVGTHPSQGPGSREGVPLNYQPGDWSTSSRYSCHNNLGNSNWGGSTPNPGNSCGACSEIYGGCAASTGGVPESAACGCDLECIQYGDCCEDFCDACQCMIHEVQQGCTGAECGVYGSNGYCDCTNDYCGVGEQECESGTTPTTGTCECRHADHGGGCKGLRWSDYNQGDPGGNNNWRWQTDEELGSSSTTEICYGPEDCTDVCDQEFGPSTGFTALDSRAVICDDGSVHAVYCSNNDPNIEGAMGCTICQVWDDEWPNQDSGHCLPMSGRWHNSDSQQGSSGYTITGHQICDGTFSVATTGAPYYNNPSCGGCEAVNYGFSTVQMDSSNEVAICHGLLGSVIFGDPSDGSGAAWYGDDMKGSCYHSSYEEHYNNYVIGGDVNNIDFDDYVYQGSPTFCLHEDCWCCPDCTGAWGNFESGNGYPDPVGANGIVNYENGVYILTQYCVHPTESWNNISYETSPNLCSFCDSDIVGATWWGVPQRGACVHPETGYKWWPSYDDEAGRKGCVWDENSASPGFVDHCLCKGLYGGGGGSASACGYTAPNGECYYDIVDPSETNCFDPGACNYNGQPPRSFLCNLTETLYDSPTDCFAACGGMPPGSGPANCTSASEINQETCDYPIDCNASHGCGPGTCPNGFTEFALPINQYRFECDELLCDACNINNIGVCGYEPACANFTSDGLANICDWTSGSGCADCPTIEGCFGNPSACNNNTDTAGTNYPDGCPDGYTCNSNNCVMPIQCTHGGQQYCPGDGTRCPCGTAIEALENAFGTINGLLMNDFYDMSSCSSVNQCGTGTEGYCNSEGVCNYYCIPNFSEDAFDEDWIGPGSGNSCDYNNPLGNCLTHSHTAARYCYHSCNPSYNSSTGQYVEPGGTCKATQYQVGPGTANYPYVCGGAVGSTTVLDDENGSWSNYFPGKGVNVYKLSLSISSTLGCYWDGGYQSQGSRCDCTGNATTCSGSDTESMWWDFNSNAPDVSTYDNLGFHNGRYRGHCYQNDGQMPYCSNEFLWRCGDTSCGGDDNTVYFRDWYPNGSTGSDWCTCDPCDPYTSTWYSNGSGMCFDIFGYGMTDQYNVGHSYGCESSHPCSTSNNGSACPSACSEMNCTSSSEYVDNYGDDCSDYVGYSHWCGNYDDGVEGTSNACCCACGGSEDDCDIGGSGGGSCTGDCDCPAGTYWDGASCYDCEYCCNSYDDSSCASPCDCAGMCNCNPALASNQGSHTKHLKNKRLRRVKPNVGSPQIQSGAGGGKYINHRKKRNNPNNRISSQQKNTHLTNTRMSAERRKDIMRNDRNKMKKRKGRDR